MPIDAPDPIQGMAGVKDFKTEERPQSWRKGLLYQEPNGDASLTALTALMPSFKIDDYKHNWPTKNLPPRRGDVTGAYTNAALSSLYTSGGVSGDIIYLKMSEEHAKRFRYSNNVMIANSNDASAFVVSKQIAEPVLNGASSYITVKLNEDDDNSQATPANDISDADGAVIMGNSNPQGSLRPRALSYKTTWHYNYTQIFRNALDLTRTRMQTRTRIGDPYKLAKQDALTEHMLDIEWALWMSERSMTENSDNGEVETNTRGLVNWIKTEAPENFVFFNLETDSFFTGKTFREVGWDWLQLQMELSSRYTMGKKRPQSKIVFCGNLALRDLQRAIETKAGAGIELVPNQLEFGIKVRTLISPFITWHLKVHPLFVHEPMMNRAMVVVQPDALNWGYIQDTTFNPQGDKKRGEGGKDGVDEDYLTEALLEVHYPNTFMFLGGIGLDNEVVS